MSKAWRSITEALFYLIIVIYIGLLARLLLFKYVTPLEIFDADKTIYRGLNLTPFRTICSYFSANANMWISLMNVIGNIAVFIPMGMYARLFLRSKRLLISVAAVGGISLCVEAVQYILGIGAADVDDVLLNTAGGLLGVLVYIGLLAALRDEKKTKTAIIVMWVIFGACCLLFFLYITFFTNLKVRLF